MGRIEFPPSETERIGFWGECQKLKFGNVNFEMSIRHPSEDVKIGVYELEFQGRSLG